LVSPFGLAAHAGSLGLDDLELILGFGVKAIKWDDTQGLVEETGVLVFRRSDRKSFEQVEEFQRGGILRWRWDDWKSAHRSRW
jgi:hypothetical protein